MDLNSKPVVKRNPVWKNALQEQNLCEEINKFGSLESEKADLVSIERGVESYKYSTLDTNAADHRSKNHLTSSSKTEEVVVERKPNLDERLGEAVSFDPSKSRSHVHVTELDTDQAVAKEIAKHLNENNLDIINRCVKVLGRKKSLEILFATEDVEEMGGMFTSDGYRRRSPGGVYLQLLKRDDSILSVQKKQIFIEDEEKKKKKKVVKRLKQKAKLEIAKKVLREQVKLDSQKESSESKENDLSTKSDEKTEIDADDLDELQEDNMIYFED